MFTTIKGVLEMMKNIEIINFLASYFEFGSSHGVYEQ